MPIRYAVLFEHPRYGRHDSMHDFATRAEANRWGKANKKVGEKVIVQPIAKGGFFGF